MSAPPSDDMLGLPEVAARERVCDRTVRGWVRGIRLRRGGPLVRLVPDRVVGNRDRFLPATVDAFCEACRREKHGPVVPERVETPAEERRRAEAAQERVRQKLAAPPATKPAVKR